MTKIKLLDFLEFVNFRCYDGNDNFDTKIIRILYPDKDKPTGFDKDRFFEYGVYDFGNDKRKRLIQTINPFILNCFVSDVYVDNGVLTIYVVTEKDLDREISKTMYYSEDGE